MNSSLTNERVLEDTTYVDVYKMREILGGIKTEAAYRILSSGQIESHKKGRKHYIPLDEIAFYKNEILCLQEPDKDYMIYMRRYYDEQFIMFHDVLNIQDLSKMLGYSGKTVLKWINMDEIKFIKYKLSYKIPKEWAIDFVLSKTYRTMSRKSDKHIQHLLGFKQSYRSMLEER